MELAEVLCSLVESTYKKKKLSQNKDILCLPCICVENVFNRMLVFFSNTIRWAKSISFVLRQLFLFNLNFFFHINFFSMCIVEHIFQKCQFLVGNNLDTESVFHLPFPF